MKKWHHKIDSISNYALVHYHSKATDKFLENQFRYWSIFQNQYLQGLLDSEEYIDLMAGLYDLNRLYFCQWYNRTVEEN